MKNLNFILVPVILAAVCIRGQPADAQTCFPPPAGIVAWWQGESNTVDIVNGNYGTLEGGATFAPGEVGLAFAFNGSDQFVQIPDSPSLDSPESLTLECWFNSSNNYGSLICKPVGGGSADSYAFWLQNGALHGAVYGQLATGNGISYGFTAVPGVWYHAAYTVDYINKIQLLYIDGVPVVSGAVNSTAIYDTSPVLIGADNDSGSFSSLGSYDLFFTGEIDEVSIYGRALSSNEIAAIYNSGSAGKCTGTNGFPPVIFVQPQNQFAFIGGSATFSVSAVGSVPLAYQWLNGNNPIDGATNITLTLTNVQTTNAGNYSVIVSNGSGSVTSSPPASLSVTLANVYIAFYPGIKIDGLVGNTYGIQSTTNLNNTASWIGRTNLTLSVTPVIWSDYQPSPSQEFYRVVPGPISIP